MRGIIYDKAVQSLGEKFDLSFWKKAILECLWASHAQYFLTVIPIEGLGQHTSAVKYQTILKYHLMVPLYPIDEPCPVCHKVCLDKFDEHAVHYKKLPGFIYMHDLVRDLVFCDVLKREGISAKKEAPVNFLTDPLKGMYTLRPVDVLSDGHGGNTRVWTLHKYLLLLGLGGNGSVVGQAMLKAESGKVAKHEKACSENQHVFILFAFDTFGSLAPEAVTFLDRATASRLI